ncbi:MAG: hypothetical protein EWV88_06870 [Microcystis wesenbergii Mw_MB_S_20031200_S109D]|uniref:Uncharacterized protein n=1 Tax=Microcystis wesenbergii Mw_MB_S_20031200_S109D TaxID=2486241 RepID=A0A552M0X4_9CHRO|nr:MAG: hypothetical protein EWV88_06870 [Microcystis wesenbergii Mw_MB_S_20031200_S109D]
MEFFKQVLVVELGIATALLLTAFPALLLYALFRSYVKIKILRYELISLSDWSANTIQQIGETASEALVAEVLTFRPHLSRNDAEMFVPNDVSNAIKLWEDECDRIQIRLVRNGIKPLNIEDKQFLLSSLFK